VTNTFFAIEQAIRRPGDTGLTYDLGHATRPHAALSLQETVYNDSVIRASDSGYCSLPTDPDGPIPYPPRVQEAFAIDAMVNLDPTASAVGASWGAIQLANADGTYDSIVTGGWVADGRDTHILYGQKTHEVFDGVASACSVPATYVDANKVVQLADPMEVRQDYASVVTLDPTATNTVRNANAVGGVGGTVGSGGVLPAGWSASAGGLAIEFSAYRTSAIGGVPTVVRLRFHGITTATTGVLYYGTQGGVQGLQLNQSVTQSVHVSRSGGAFTNVTQIVHWLAVTDATAVGFGTPQPNFLPSITTTLTRFSRVVTLPATGPVPFTTANAAIVFYWAVGATIDFTIDVAAPQVEFGAVMTPFIPTTAAAEVTHGDGAVNYIPNSTMTGAVAGTPGTLPTGWSVNLGTNISQQVVAVGTDAVTGQKYIDLRFSGTSGSTLTNIHFASAIDALTGQAWCQSVYAQFVAGSQAGITFALGVQETDSAGAFLAFKADTASALSLNGISRARRVVPITTNQATTRSISPSLWVTYASGVAIDVTIRLMAPQLEGGGLVTAFIPTTSAPAGRRETYSVTGTPVTMNEPDATNYVLSTQTPSVANVTVAVSTDVPAIYAGVPVWKHLRTATGTDSASGTIGVAGMPSALVTIRASAWVWIPSSFAAGKTLAHLRIEGTGITGAVYSNTVLTLLDQWQRVTCTATLAAGSTAASIVLRMSPQVAGDVIYTSAWQMEVDTGAVTSFIPPATTPAVRPGDYLYTARNILIDPPYASLVPAFNGVAGSITSDDTQVTIPLRDASYWLERPLLRSTYGGNGQLDGTTELTGTLKPLMFGGTKSAAGNWFGPANNATPVLVDPPALIYQLNDGPIGQIAALYEGGYAGGITFAGDVADLYTGSTPSGQYRTCVAKGCFQLGSTPTRAITCDVNGASIGVDATSRAVAAYALTTLCGVPPNLVALTGGVLSSIGATAARNNGCAIYLGPQDNISGVDLMTRILAPPGMKLVACRDGMLRAYVIAALPASPTIKAKLDSRTIISITPIDLPTTLVPQPYRMRVGYNDNYTSQTSDLSPLITTARKQYLATPNSVSQANSPNLVNAIIRPNDPPVITGSIVDNKPSLLAAAAASQSANQYIALWGVRRRAYAIVVPFLVGIPLEYGDVVAITTDIGDLTGTKNGQVVGYSYRSEDASITLRILV
jgi:hypothetical protein